VRSADESPDGLVNPPVHHIVVRRLPGIPQLEDGDQQSPTANSASHSAPASLDAAVSGHAKPGDSTNAGMPW
jgi:hypothetical protein